MLGKLQQIHMHEQRLAAARGVLQADLVEVFNSVSADARFAPLALVVLVEALDKFIERCAQTLAVVEVAVEVDFDKQQGEPLEVLPGDFSLVLTPGIDGPRMCHQVGVETLQLNWSQCCIGRQVREQLRQKAVLAVRANARLGVAQRFGDYLQWPHRAAFVLMCHQRIDAK
ncbi:hypothetical protein D3C84_737630 [compost metagenome]